MRNFSVAVVAMAALLGSAVAANAAFSDDFSTPQATSTNSMSSGFDTGNTLMTSYGGRTIQTDILSNGAPGDSRGRTAISGGNFSYSSDDGVTGFGYLAYTFSTPINLTLTPDFQVNLLRNDATGTFRIDVTDSSGAVSTASYMLYQVFQFPPPPGYTGSPLTVNFTYAANPAGINLASVSKLAFYFGGTQDEDLSVDAIQAVVAPGGGVPEPGTWGMIVMFGSLAGASLWVQRRRAS